MANSQNKFLLICKQNAFFYFFLCLILASFGIRMLQFGDTYSGYHLVRQMDNLASIEDYYFEGINFLKRKVLGGGGVNGYALLELPVYQTLVVWLSPSYEALQPTARYLNLVFSLLSVILVFKISNSWFGRTTALYSSLFFAFAPLNLSYQRAFMMDISTVCFCLFSTWFLIKILETPGRIWNYLFFILFGAACVVTKPLYFLPVVMLFLTNFFLNSNPLTYSNIFEYVKSHFRLVVAFFFITASLIGWLLVVKTVNGEGQGMMGFIQWEFLLSPKFYFLMVFRFVTLILNPFTTLMFIIGVALIWKQRRKKDEVSLIFTIPLYYALFGQINFPHEYYSLIMVPYCSIIAGHGTQWLEEQLTSHELVKFQQVWKGIICLVVSLTSIIIFLLNFIIGSPGLNQTTLQIEREMATVLTPRTNSYVFMNKTGFPITDFLKHNRALFVLAKVKPLTEIEVRDRGTPISSQEVLFALRQYGQVQITEDKVPDFDSAELQKMFRGNLHYTLFYKYNSSQRSAIKTQMSNHTLTYSSADWLVFELKDHLPLNK